MRNPREKHRYGIPRFYRLDSNDVFEKCRLFAQNFESVDAERLLTDCHRVEFRAGLDRATTLADAVTGTAREVLLFDSNGYLGLHHHPVVKRSAVDAIEEMGVGTPSVPLLGGTNHLVRKVEERIAAFHGRESALLFSSAYAANVSLASALARKCDYIIHDESVHASTLQGIRLCEPRGVEAFRTNDLADLGAKLARANELREEIPGDLLVFVEGIYSMEGEIVKLPELRELCDRYRAKLIIDECHSAGVLGPRGRGVEDHFGLPGSADLIVGCFSKAFGLIGGYVTGPAPVILYLRYLSGAYVFSTSLPAPICAAIAESIALVDREPAHLERLHRNVATFRGLFRSELGLPVPGSGSAIFKIRIPENKRLFTVGKALLDRGLKCGVVTYPAVRDQHGLLRIVVTSRHTEHDLRDAVRILKSVLGDHGLLAET